MSKQNNNRLELDNVTIEFDTVSGGKIRALNNVTLHVNQGELVAVVGRSGCGKSTLLNIIAGLAIPTSGSVQLNNKPISKPSRERGVVFQSDVVFGWKKIGENVDFALKLGGIPKDKRPELIRKYLNLVNLGDFASFYPKELSGGMRKRLQIAMVLANEPSLLLMDEPFGPLDYATKVELQLELESIRSKNPITTFFVTHDVEEATFVADRIILIEKGEILEEIEVPFERPRAIEIRKSKEFYEITDHLLSILLSLSKTRTEV